MPAGNSALVALCKDKDSIELFIGILHKELLRRLGLDVTEFFVNDKFLVDLLHSIRSDIATLQQSDQFNTDIENLMLNRKVQIDKNCRQDRERLFQLPLQVQFWRREI